MRFATCVSTHGFATGRGLRPRHEFAIRFFFGCLITVVTGLIANKFGPAVGGLFLAFPAIFPATTTLIASHEKEKKQRVSLDGTRRGRDAAALESRGTALSTNGLFAFGLIVWRLLPTHRAWLILTAAAGSWLSYLSWFGGCESLCIAPKRSRLVDARHSTIAHHKFCNC
jgi:hypothetical protein